MSREQATAMGRRGGSVSEAESALPLLETGAGRGLRGTAANSYQWPAVLHYPSGGPTTLTCSCLCSNPRIPAPARAPEESVALWVVPGMAQYPLSTSVPAEQHMSWAQTSIRPVSRNQAELSQERHLCQQPSLRLLVHTAVSWLYARTVTGPQAELPEHWAWGCH